MMKSEVLPIRLWQNMAVSQKVNQAGVLSIHSLQVESIFPVAHNAEKVKMTSLSEIGHYEFSKQSAREIVL